MPSTAHRPVYVATVSPAHPVDLVRKLNTAKGLKGPRLILAFAPCPTGWGFDPKDTIKIGKLAVETGVWLLKEYRDGSVTHTNVPRHRRAVEEYLRHQGRFSHLFLPHRNEELLREIQSGVDIYWEGIED